MKSRKQAARRHHAWRLYPSSGKESRSEIREDDKVVDGAARRNVLAPANGKRHVYAEVIEVALSARETGNAVIAADNQQRVFQFASLLEFVDDHAHAGVKRLHFTQVVAHVLPHRMIVRQEWRHAALEVVRIQSPLRLAAPFDPGAVAVRRPEPVAKWLALFAILEEPFKIPSNFTIPLCLARRSSLD